MKPTSHKPLLWGSGTSEMPDHPLAAQHRPRDQHSVWTQPSVLLHVDARSRDEFIYFALSTIM